MHQPLDIAKRSGLHKQLCADAAPPDLASGISVEARIRGTTATGIQASGLIHDNRVYHNSQAGILGIVGLTGSSIYGNTVYSNQSGQLQRH